MAPKCAAIRAGKMGRRGGGKVSVGVVGKEKVFDWRSNMQKFGPPLPLLPHLFAIQAGSREERNVTQLPINLRYGKVMVPTQTLQYKPPKSD